MSFINEVHIEAQSIREIRPISIKWEDVSNDENNEVIISRRRSMANLRADPVDLSLITHVDGNQVLLEGFFLAEETPKPGRYIITVVIKDVEAPAAQLEVNIIGDVFNVL